MDKNIQNLFFKFLVVFIVVLSFGVLSWGYYNYRQAQNIVNPERVITFTEEGKVITKPDIAELNFSVVTQGEQAADVQNENNKKMQQVIDFVKKQDVSEEDIQTTNYSLNPQYDYNWCKTSSVKPYTSCPPKIIGYELTQTATIKIRDFDKINTIVGGLSQVGANQISNISFSVDNQEDYKNQARIEALKKIEKRAQLLSKETSLKLGKIVSVLESGVYPIYRDTMMKAESSGGAMTPAPIETGTQEITITLTVSYEIR
ncbi:MAG: SIMPL domain-containing protein [Candidatus Paceibacterota bacterium]|jgi:hypothetical protein